MRKLDIAQVVPPRTRAALIEALNSRFDDHHAELTRMLLDQVDALSAQIGKLTGSTGPGAAALPAASRLDEITGIGPDGSLPPASLR